MPTAGEAKLLKSIDNHAELPVSSRTRSKSGSRIPINIRSSAKSSSSIPATTTTGGTTRLNRNANSCSKVKPAPDFSKLHRKWNQNFEKGKALKKKPCTLAQGFDMSHPGVQIKPANVQDTHAEEKHEQLVLESKEKSTLTSCRNKLRRKNGKANLMDHSKVNNEENEFNHLAEAQMEAGIEFHQDDTALSSILNETGVCVEQLQHEKGTFKTPSLKPNAKVPHTRTRSSVYYQHSDRPSTAQAYSDFVQHFVSRLALGSMQKSKHLKEIAQDLADSKKMSPVQKSAIVRKQGSVYVKYANSTSDLPNPVSATRDSVVPNRIHCDAAVNSPAWRVPLVPRGSTAKSPAKRISKTSMLTSPAPSRISMTEPKNAKWKDVLVPNYTSPKDPTKKRLEFSEGASPEKKHVTETDVDVEQLKEIEEMEKRLEKEILNMEFSKQTQYERRVSPHSIPRTDLDVNEESDKTVRIKAQKIGAQVAQNVLEGLPLGIDTPVKNILFSDNIGQSPNCVKNSPKMKKSKSQVLVDKENSTPPNVLRKSQSVPLQTLSPNISRSNTNTPPKKSVRFTDYSSPSLYEAMNDKENFTVFEDKIFSKDSSFDSPKANYSKTDLSSAINEINQTLSESYVQYSEVQYMADENAIEFGCSDQSLVKQLEQIKKEQEKLKRMQLALQKQLKQQEMPKILSKKVEKPSSKVTPTLELQKLPSKSKDFDINDICKKPNKSPTNTEKGKCDAKVEKNNKPVPKLSVIPDKAQDMKEDKVGTTLVEQTPITKSLRKMEAEVRRNLIHTPVVHHRPVGAVLRTPITRAMANSFNSISQNARHTPLNHSQSGGIMSVARNSPITGCNNSLLSTPISSPGTVFSSPATETGSHQHLFQRTPSSNRFSASPCAETGSLSLLANVACCQNQLVTRPVQPARYLASLQYQEALLHDEVAMYSCQFPSNCASQAASVRSCWDPVATLLQYGDDRHFIPVQLSPVKYSVLTGRPHSLQQPVEGSAFTKLVTLQ